MQDPEQPADPYNPDVLSDAEIGFDLVAYLRDHPIASGVIVLLIVVFFFWLMRRRTRE